MVGACTQAKIAVLGLRGEPLSAVEKAQQQCRDNGTVCV